MDTNSQGNYVLVLEDRTVVKSDQEVGTLSIVLDIDDSGKLKTTETKETHQDLLLKFNNQDGLLKNFI